MPIINQNYDPSEKKVGEVVVFSAVTTGVTLPVRISPWNSLLQGVNVSAHGLSGSPVHSLSIQRMVAGVGFTGVNNLGLTLTVQAMSVSGCVGFSIPAPGITLLTGDLLVLTTGASSTAVGQLCLNVVISALDDIKVYQNTVA